MQPRCLGLGHRSLLGGTVCRRRTLSSPLSFLFLILPRFLTQRTLQQLAHPHSPGHPAIIVRNSPNLAEFLLRACYPPLRACADRLATFHSCRFCELSNRLL